jgi:hypothetical protein
MGYSRLGATYAGSGKSHPLGHSVKSHWVPFHRKGSGLSPNMSGLAVPPFEIGHLLCSFGEMAPLWVFGEMPLQ